MSRFLIQKKLCFKFQSRVNTNSLIFLGFFCRSSSFFILVFCADFTPPLSYYILFCCCVKTKMSRSPDAKEDPVECPLCMEPLEIDDINFFPCTCGYQICRFCWHRIRTDENGLCPACRKVSICVEFIIGCVLNERFLQMCHQYLCSKLQWVEVCTKPWCKSSLLRKIVVDAGSMSGIAMQMREFSPWQNLQHVLQTSDFVKSNDQHWLHRQ